MHLAQRHPHVLRLGVVALALVLGVGSAHAKKPVKPPPDPDPSTPVSVPNSPLTKIDSNHQIPLISSAVDFQS